jgi:hypothetical protein
VGMLTSAVHAGRAVASDEVSPELALVDHLLAADARILLAEPDDTLGRLERELAFRRLAARSARCDSGSANDLPAHRPAIWSDPRIRHWLRPRLAGATAVAAGFAAALLLGVEVNLRGASADADPFVAGTGALNEPLSTPRATVAPSPTSAPTTEASPRTKMPRSSPGRSSPPAQADVARSASRRFAWAPVSGASAYRVEFFRGSTLVYTASTSRPQIELPVTWTFGGRQERLAPGRYRWYVWPVHAGVQDSSATVQAALVIH